LLIERGSAVRKNGGIGVEPLLYAEMDQLLFSLTLGGRSVRKLYVRGLVLACAISGGAHLCPAHGQETQFGHIVTLQTGSLGGPSRTLGLSRRRIDADDTVFVKLDVPFVNSGDLPAQTLARQSASAHEVPCSITTAGYALDPKDPGVKVNESVLLSAFMAGKKVRLTLDGCVFNKPRIISVTVSNEPD
jgi:hypothetical protein